MARGRRRMAVAEPWLVAVAEPCLVAIALAVARGCGPWPWVVAVAAPWPTVARGRGSWLWSVAVACSSRASSELKVMVKDKGERTLLLHHLSTLKVF